MAKRSYCIIDDENLTVTFVPEKMTKKDIETTKVLIELGYKAKRTTVNEMYPKKDLFTKENVYAFLESKGKDELEKFKEKEKEIAKDENGVAKTHPNGNPRYIGYIGALKEFRKEYEEEFKKYITK